MGYAAPRNSLRYRRDAREKPSKLQGSFCNFIVSRCSLKQAALQRLTIPDSISEQYWVASGALSQKPGAFVTFSLPALSQTIFLCLSDGVKDVYEQLICETCAKSECNDAYRVGYAERVSNHRLNDYGWSALLFARPKDSLKIIPDKVIVEGQLFKFVVLVPITEVEYDTWVKSGYDALVKEFARHKRGLLSSPVRGASSMDQSAPKALRVKTESRIQRLGAAVEAAHHQGAQMQVASAHSQHTSLPECGDLGPQPLGPENSADSLRDNELSDDTRSDDSRINDARIDDKDAAILRALEYWYKQHKLVKRSAVCVAIASGVIAATAMGILPAVFVAAGTVALVDACKDASASRRLL